MSGYRSHASSPWDGPENVCCLGNLRSERSWCPSDGDAVVEVPGYDVRVIPTSGVLQTAIYWAIAGGMAGAAQRGGARL